MKEEEKLINIYEKIIFGDDDTYGLLDCYDAYYSGIWDDLLIDAKVISNKINAPTGSKKEL